VGWRSGAGPGLVLIVGELEAVVGTVELHREQALGDRAGGVAEGVAALALEVIAVDVGVGPEAEHARADAAGLDLLEPLPAQGGAVEFEVVEHPRPDLAIRCRHGVLHLPAQSAVAVPAVVVPADEVRSAW
jgi:hypothetical protein